MTDIYNYEKKQDEQTQVSIDTRASVKKCMYKKAVPIKKTTF